MPNTDRKKIFGVILFVVFPLLLLVLVELTAIGILNLQKIPRKAFLINRLPKFSFIDKNTQYPYIDPFLGYASDRPFVSFGRAPSESVPTVVTLGGSTTASYSDSRSWPDFFAEEANKSNLPVTVLNGATGGYASNQALLKVIRDVLPHKPRVIITYDGACDLGYNSLAEHPLHSPYQKSVFETALSPSPLLLPNTIYLGGLFSDALFKKHKVQVRYGEVDKSSPAENWIKNVRLTHAISKEYGIEHLAFLQNTHGIGEYEPNEKEKKDLEAIDWGGGASAYLETLKTFYGKTRAFCHSVSYCVDLVDLYKGKSGLYNDPRHPNEEGYHLIAKKILEEVSARNFLATRSP